MLDSVAVVALTAGSGSYVAVAVVLTVYYAVMTVVLMPDFVARAFALV